MYKKVKFDPENDKNPDFMREIEEYIKDPDFYLTDVDFNKGPHMFLYNPQLLFFGVPSYLLKNVSRDQELGHNFWLETSLWVIIFES